MRDLVVVSGYYGFANLGDEAILEQLTNELKQLVSASKIVVLSNNPDETQNLYGVRAVDRWSMMELIKLLAQTRLFISGGGGLMQDTRSAGSVVYYGGQILLARMLGARAVVYSQGLGPLNSSISRIACRTALSLCDAISVRDEQSRLLAEGWGLRAQLTADPVWNLKPTPVPEPVRRQVADLRSGGGSEPTTVVGLSLRNSAKFGPEDLKVLDQALAGALPENAALLLLPLQKDMDEPILDQVAALWTGRGRRFAKIDPDLLERPSQWLSLMAELDFLVAMRLHALIMALQQGVAVAGLAYDPKVTLVLSDFDQPILNLTKEAGKKDWKSVIEEAFLGRAVLSDRAAAKAASAKDLSCQNFNLLARILGMQSDSRTQR